MVKDKKRRFIKDPVWGNIELFPWEAKLLSHFAVNRLHKVLQTSNAFLVYPGLKYSRFVHSLGALYTATQVFINLLANSEKKYLSILGRECKQIESNFTNDDQKKEFIKIITATINCPRKYALLLGTIRTAALLHDIGHLPYSHIFEFALERFIQNSFSVNLDLLTYKPKPDELDELEKLHSQLEDIFKSGFSSEHIHESMGKSLLRLLHNAAKESDKDIIEPYEDFEPFIQGSMQIWITKDLPVSKSLLSADIDADRIDFVYRDGFYSGLFHSSVDFARLFSFYELAEAKNSEGEIHILARPSFRASSESEKLLWERFLDYKYIMSHHKVHLFDELLERLLLISLCGGELNDILKAIISLAHEMTGLRLTRRKQRVLDAERALLSIFDDSWIDVQLRTAYEKALIRDDEILLNLFEGLSERRDLFKSLFKYDEEYHRRGFIIDSNLKSFQPLLVSLDVKANKYVWEHTLTNRLGTTVVIGDLSNKLRIGIQDKVAAEFFGLTALKEFLESKLTSSRLFNAWYFSQSGERQPNVETEIVDFMKKNLSDFYESPAKSS